jgi:hypothetical protein
MKFVDSLYVGWVDTSIRAHTELLPQFGCVLVTSLDSVTNIGTTVVGRRIVDENPGCSFLGDGLVIPGTDIKRVIGRYNLFTGFDEIWCFGEKPELSKPRDVWLVAPRNIERGDLPSGLVSWMDRSRCVLGVGDGIGLNYATPDRSIAELLDGLVNPRN